MIQEIYAIIGTDISNNEAICGFGDGFSMQAVSSNRQLLESAMKDLKTGAKYELKFRIIKFVRKEEENEVH